MNVIEKATLFTEITIEESATVSGGGCNEKPTSGGSTSSSNASSYSNANVTITINNPGNSSSNSPTPIPTPTGRLLPVFDSDSGNTFNV